MDVDRQYRYATGMLLAFVFLAIAGVMFLSLWFATEPASTTRTPTMTTSQENQP